MDADFEKVVRYSKAKMSELKASLGLCFCQKQFLKNLVLFSRTKLCNLWWDAFVWASYNFFSPSHRTHIKLKFILYWLTILKKKELTILLFDMRNNKRLKAFFRLFLSSVGLYLRHLRTDFWNFKSFGKYSMGTTKCNTQTWKT